MSKQLKNNIEYCLKNFPDCRDSDIVLTIRVWLNFYPEFIVSAPNNGKAVQLRDLLKLPREDSCKRIRADFNEKGLYLSDNPDVRRRRQQKEIEVRQEMMTPRFNPDQVEEKKQVPLFNMAITRV